VWQKKVANYILLREVEVSGQAITEKILCSVSHANEGIGANDLFHDGWFVLYTSKKIKGFHLCCQT
jgi:hypothetical protein